MTRDEYQQYLESDVWQRTRRHKLEEAQYRCELCNSSTRLQVHHRDYSRIGNERLTDLTVLCDECHERHHHKMPESRVKLPEPDPMDSLTRFNQMRKAKTA
jgi:5-methylcytosine-specific restriction endonuclease McrA